MEKPLALIVEDHESLSEIMAEAIAEAGYEPRIVQTGDDALEQLSTVVPVLVVLDLQLPGVEGTDILDRIRSDERLANTKVVVATAHSHRSYGLREKADLLLLKPIGYEQLRDLAARLLLEASASPS